MPWSAIIGAASSLIGGALNRSGSSSANERAAEQAEVARQDQERFAKLGLTWRAEDAINAYKKTGIHPLAMLGVQGATYTPVSAAFTPSGMGDSIARAGQDVSRAISANADRGLRQEQLDLQRAHANLLTERSGLENEALRLQIEQQKANLARSMTPGVGFSNVVGPSWEYVKTPTGYMLLKSRQAQERLEDDFIGTSIWNAGHRSYIPPPPIGVRVPAGMKWVYRRGSQEYQLKPLDWVDPEVVVPKGNSPPVVLGPHDVYRPGRHGSQRD